MTDWPETPEAVAAEIWRRLGRATKDRKAAWRFCQLATVMSEGPPAIRTLVLRSANSADCTVDLHSDARSEKIADLTAQPQAALHFWDPRGQTQLRLGGHVTVLGPKEPETRTIWQALPDGARAPYRQAAIPGAPIADPAEAIDTAAPRDDDAAFADFRVLRLRVRAIDWLWLRGGGHRRARLAYATDGSLAEAAWIGP